MGNDNNHNNIIINILGTSYIPGNKSFTYNNSVLNFLNKAEW